MDKFEFLLLLFFCSFGQGAGAAMLQNLKVEYASCPLSVDVQSPRFSWQMAMDAGERGLMQAAYRVSVFTEAGLCVWDSGKITGGNSLNVEYAGEPLRAESHYDWKVCVWTQHGDTLTASSWFETGLMAHGGVGECWDGAKWIGGGDDCLVLYSHYLPVFKLNYKFRLDLDSNSLSAAFVYGANDERLMDANKNLYGLVNGTNESYVKVEFDAARLLQGKEAEVRVYRSGFCPMDNPQRPLAVFTVPATAFKEADLYREHNLIVTSNLGFTRIFLDDEAKALGEINLNPLGQGGDFIAFPVVGDVGFCHNAGKSCTSLGLEVANFRSPGNVMAVVCPPESMGRTVREDTLYVANPSRNSAPMLRTAFTTNGKKVVKARLYATARGIYDFYINGRRVGDDYFNPGVSQYNKTHFYQIFDVTSYVNDGENAVGAVLSEGWWSGGCTYAGENWNYFGNRQSLLAKLVLTYADGSTDVVVTNPDTWKLYCGGPVVYGSFFQGEVYDARLESDVAGWSTPSYDDSGWSPVVEVPLQGTVSTEGGGNSPKVDDYSHYKLVGQSGQTVKAVKELTALSVEEVRPGVFVYDMGQNMVGVPRVSLADCVPGQRICLRFAEVKYPNLARYAGNEGMIMLENIRAAMSQDVYICRGGREVVAPRFTYHGYRYVEITGIERPLPLESVKGIVLSSVYSLLSNYETSNKDVNKLWENITWSTYGNFLSIPTDCPQRNERIGWAGDISVFSHTATYLADVPNFLRRYLCAMRDVQREDGRFPDIAPLGGGFGGLLWGSAGLVVPWECYVQYGDKALLEEHYPAMKRYINYVLEKCIHKDTGMLVQENVWGNLGDWLGPEDGRNDASLLWESYFIYDLYIIGKAASVLGLDEDKAYYNNLRKERMEFFNITYVDASLGKTVSAGNKKLVDTQTSYVLPLAFGIVSDSVRNKMITCFANTVKRENVTDDGIKCPPYSLMTGFIGTAWISRVLSDCGLNDLAYNLLQQTSYPSWLYSVKQGATTIWERLNSYTHTNGFGGNNRMNSFNHYSFGAVGGWMYNYSLGIRADDRNPGFKHFYLMPIPDPTGVMTYARGYYDSMYGRIESGWSVQDEDKVIYSFYIPANTTATVCLQCSATSHVEVNGARVGGDVEYGLTGDCFEMKLEPGDYEIIVAGD